MTSEMVPQLVPDVKRIVEKCPRNRQTQLFSATIPPQIDTLIRWAMKSPETVEIGMRRSPAETVTMSLCNSRCYPFQQTPLALAGNGQRHLLDPLHFPQALRVTK